MLGVHRAPPGTPEQGMPYGPAPVPGGCGLSLATSSTIALCNFGLLSTGCTSPEMSLLGLLPSFLYQGFSCCCFFVFFFFFNPFKSLGRMAQCGERSCVTELRGSHSPQNQYSCHSGCICVCVWGGLLPL